MNTLKFIVGRDDNVPTSVNQQVNFPGSRITISLLSGVMGPQGNIGPQGSIGPQGVTGSQGNQGPGFVFQGSWNPSGHYIAGQDVVIDVDGSTYIKIGGDGNSGSSPYADSLRWGLFTQAIIGPQGRNRFTGFNWTTRWFFHI
jgi:hypothetical protein